MASKIQQLWARIGLPAFWSAPAKAKTPPTKVVGRTGDARYVPQMAHWATDKRGTTTRIASRMDDVRIQDYDRARFYPVVRDALKTLRAPLTRANVHFACQDQVIADLLTQELGPLLPELINTLVKGSMEFGWQVVEKRWVPKFNVSVSTGGQQGGQKSERIFPFIWTISRFASFSPQDTRILVNPRNGDFAGIRQFIRATGEDQDVPATKCVHFAYDKEYDGNYGVSAIKSAIPFIEAAESVYDSMTLYSQLFASPYKVGRYPGGKLPTKDAQGNSELIHNADLMEGLVTSLEGGHSIVLPSDMNDGGGYKWDLQFMEAPGGSDSYVDKLNHLNEMIRVSLAVPQYASSGTPDSGTYNLGESQINLFLQNAEGILDQLAHVITASVVEDFVNFNFGVDAPRARMYFEPLDQNVTKMLLQSLLQMLGSGQPMQDADGNMLYPDWGKIAQDKGVPIVQQEPQTMAQQLAQQAAQRLQGMGGGADGGQQSQQPAPQLPNVPQDLQLAEFEESKHPRKKDGKFAPKGGGKARGGDVEESTSEAPTSAKQSGGNKVVDRSWFKDNAEKLQDAGWTKGKKPNLIVADGGIFKIETTGAGQYTLVPATRADIMPAILKKIDDPTHRLHSLKAALDGAPTPPTPDKAPTPSDNAPTGNTGAIDESHPTIVAAKEAHAKIDNNLVQVMEGIKKRASGYLSNGNNISTVENMRDAIVASFLEQELLIKNLETGRDRARTRKIDFEEQLANATDDGARRYIALELRRVESQIAMSTQTIDTQMQDPLWSKVDAMLDFVDPAERGRLLTEDVRNAPGITEFAEELKAHNDNMERYNAMFEQNADVLHAHATNIGKTGESMPDYLHNEHIPAKHQNELFNKFGGGIIEHYEEKAYASLPPSIARWRRAVENEHRIKEAFRRERYDVAKKYGIDTEDTMFNPDVRLPDGSTSRYSDTPEMTALRDKYTPMQEAAWQEKEDAQTAAVNDVGLAGLDQYRTFSPNRQVAAELTMRHGPVTQTFNRAIGTRAVKDRCIVGLKIYPERMRKKIESSIKDIRNTTARARFEPADKIVRIDTNTDTVIHELAHAMEDSFMENKSNRELDLSIAFLRKRAGAEAASTIYRGTTERGYKDRFINHYIGKIYNRQGMGDTYATEIMSMGAEHVYGASKSDDFARKDPDMFAYIVGRLAQK